MKYYIASCVFTSKYPALSKRITDYVSTFPDIKIIRCCTPGWKVGIYEEKMPEDSATTGNHSHTPRIFSPATKPIRSARTVLT